MSFYAVGVGRVPGVYLDWKSCEAQTKGFSRAAFKKFGTKKEADDYVAGFAAGDSFVTPRKRKMDDDVKDNVEDEAEKRIRLMEMEVFTDGNCYNNGKPGALAGSGVYFVRAGQPVSISSGVPHLQTNNRAEIYALALALDATLGDKLICIRPDSEYVAKGITDPTWLDHWHKNDWKKHGSRGPVKNVDLWKIVVALLEKRKAAGMRTPSVKWVKAHAEFLGNETADKLADVGMTKKVLQINI